MLFEISRLCQLMDISLVGTINDRRAYLGHLYLILMQVALTQSVSLVVR